MRPKGGGLTAWQRDVLRALREAGPGAELYAGQIGKRLGYTPRYVKDNLHERLAGLEKRGLVVRGFRGHWSTWRLK